MMQEWPGTPVGAPSAAPAAPPQAQWPGQPVSAPQAAPRRPQAAPRPASAPAPQTAPLNNLGITDAEERDALIYQGYTPEQADREMEYRRAGNGEAAMFSPEEEAANVQRRGAEDHALDRFQNRNSIDPTRAIREPWLLGEPIYMPRDEATGDVQTADGAYPLTTYPGLRTVEGGMQAFDPASHAYYAVTPEQAATIQARARQSQEERQARVNRESDPKYQAEYAAAQAGADNVPAWLANLAHGDTLGGLTYAVGASNFLDPMTEGIDRNLASQAGRDAWRDQIDALVAKDPVGSVGMQMVGGLLTPGVKGSGDWISGATGAARTGRAAVVGGGYGMASGVLNSEGDVLKDGLLGGAVGATTGGLLDLGVRSAVSGAAARAQRGSASRRLSRQGVQLTPGQMLQDTPVIGGMIRGLEDGASGVPLAGSAIQGARNEGIDSLNRVAVNRTLAPVGGELPDKVATGYEAVQYAQQFLGRKYEDLLPRITARMDDQFRQDIDGILSQADLELPADLASRLRAIVGGERVLQRAADGEVFTGEEFKKVENTLRLLTERYSRSQDVDQQAIADMLVDTRTAFSEMLARSNPFEADELRAINTGWANLSRVQRAAGGTAAVGREGQFTPGELAVATLQGATQGQRGRGGALMQDLARDAKAALPNTIGDSGTATRGAVTGLLGGAAVGALNPMLAVPVIATATLYSKPAQAALNAIYRATDRQSASSALAELQKFAGRNPALQEYYADAARYLQGAFQGPSPTTAPEARGLLTPTRQ